MISPNNSTLKAIQEVSRALEQARKPQVLVKRCIRSRAGPPGSFSKCGGSSRRTLENRDYSPHMEICRGCLDFKGGAEGKIPRYLQGALSTQE